MEVLQDHVGAVQSKERGYSHLMETRPACGLHPGGILIAPRLLLPAELRVVASCAGLTYVWPDYIVEHTEAGTHIWLCRVAAQPRYLDGRSFTFVTLLDSAMLACATTYDLRRHASMPTVDLRELVEDAAATVLFQQQQQLSLPVAARDLTQTLAPLVGQAEQALIQESGHVYAVEPEEESEPASFADGPEVIVPIAVLRQVGEKLLKVAQDRGGRRPALPVLLLRAALEVLQGKCEVAIMAALEWEACALSSAVAQIKAVLRTWRRTWASIDVVARYERGRYGMLEGCWVSLRLPVGRAA